MLTGILLSVLSVAGLFFLPKGFWRGEHGESIYDKLCDAWGDTVALTIFGVVAVLAVVVTLMLKF